MRAPLSGIWTFHIASQASRPVVLNLSLARLWEYILDDVYSASFLLLWACTWHNLLLWIYQFINFLLQQGHWHGQPLGRGNEGAGDPELRSPTSLNFGSFSLSLCYSQCELDWKGLIDKLLFGGGLSLTNSVCRENFIIGKKKWGCHCRKIQTKIWFVKPCYLGKRNVCGLFRNLIWIHLGCS